MVCWGRRAIPILSNNTSTIRSRSSQCWLAESSHTETPYISQTVYASPVSISRRVLKVWFDSYKVSRPKLQPLVCKAKCQILYRILIDLVSKQQSRLPFNWTHTYFAVKLTTVSLVASHWYWKSHFRVVDDYFQEKCWNLFLSHLLASFKGSASIVNNRK